MPPAADRTTTLELAAIVSNAARLGIPVWRVTTALGLNAAQRTAIEAAIGHRQGPPWTAESPPLDR
jgi:hypothetical protein